MDENLRQYYEQVIARLHARAAQMEERLRELEERAARAEARIEAELGVQPTSESWRLRLN